VDGQPALPLDADAAQVAAETIFQALNAEDQARVERMGSDPDSVTRNDICWFLRKKLDAIVFLERPHRQAWARALVHGKY